MTDSQRATLVITSPLGYVPEIGLLLGMLEDARTRTLERVAGATEDELEWTPAPGCNSIGTILYHLALIEADWLYTEILEQPLPAHVVALFPDDVRDESGLLTAVRGGSLPELLGRLATVRTFLLAGLRGMVADEFQRPRTLPDYDVTPEWVLHHLMQHEAEHRGEIGLLRQRFPGRAGRSNT